MPSEIMNVLGLFSWITLLAHIRCSDHSLPLPSAVCYPKSLPTFWDAIAWVRFLLWQETFCISVSDADIVNFPRSSLLRLTDTLCYATCMYKLQVSDETELSAGNTLALFLKGAATRSNSNRRFAFQQVFQSFEIACVLSHYRLMDNLIHDVFERPMNLGVNNGRQ